MTTHPDDEIFGYVEILSGIVRVGRHCHKMLDPFERAIAFSSVDGRTAILKALTANQDDDTPPLTFRQSRAGYRAVRRIGLEPRFFRAPRDKRKS